MFNFITGDQGDINLKEIQSASIQAFSKKLSSQNKEREVGVQHCSDSVCNITQEDAPTISDIQQRLPRKECLKTICQTSGIFLIVDYIFDKREREQILLLLHSNDQIDITNPLYERLISVSPSAIQEAKRQYARTFASSSTKVLAAITKCAPLVIAAHRSQIEALGRALPQNGTSMIPNIEGLLRIPYTDVRMLLQHSPILDSNDISKETSSDMRFMLLREIDFFRSPNYTLTSYFDTELQLLKDINQADHKRALEILDRVVQERNGIAPLESKGIQTKRPVYYVKQMSFLTRQVFNKLQPGDQIRFYNKKNIFSKGSQTNVSPILSFYTHNGEPLTKAHGEVYDAVCTLWAAGNEVITDGMIARTIWPRPSRNGGETFSQKELDTIRQLMDDLRQAYASIDATAELRKYKKIGKDDSWIINGSIMPCTIVYKRINGGQYIHRAYKILDTPAFFAYSAALSQILAIPISILFPHKEVFDRSPRSLRTAQVRTMLLERLHHFCSPTYKRKERTILFERIYEAYGIIENSSDINELKKHRAAARRAAVNILQGFKKAGLLSNYELRKQRGSYHSIIIEL